MTTDYTRARCAAAGLILTAIIVFSSTPAHAANIISPVPAVLSVEVGSEFVVDLIMSFDDVTVGGGVEVSFDPLLSFVSFQFDPLFTANFGLTGPAPGEAVQPLEIGFGWFLLTPIGGETGTHTIGQLTFHADGESASSFIRTASSALLPGPFFGPGAGLGPMSVQFGEAAVSIVAGASSSPGTSVPEPSSALLVLVALGLTGLAYPRRASVKPVSEGLSRFAE